MRYTEVMCCLISPTAGYCWRTYFAPDKAEISAGGAPSLWAFRGVMCEAKFRRFRVRQQYPAVFDTVTVSATHRPFKNEMMIIEMGS